MKLVMLTLATLLTGSIYAQSLVPVLELETTGLDTNDFVKIKGEYVKYINENIEENKPFKIKVLGSPDEVGIEKSPRSSVHKQTIAASAAPFVEQEIAISLLRDETVEFDITIKRKSDSLTFVYTVSLSTEREYKPNSNFIFLSAIRSVGGTPQSKEFFDLNLKFNYLERCFTLFSLDLSLSPADTSQTKVSEGLLTANCFWNSEAFLYNGELNRAFFGGLGAKIFNRQPYLGGHIGSLEINGPLFSSYVIVGYYFNAYGRYALQPLETQAVDFRNNVYSEFALAFDNKKNVVAILSDIRIKLGIMLPFTNSDKDVVKPLSKDIQYRLVLEVPIGGIFKFSQLSKSRF